MIVNLLSGLATRPTMPLGSLLTSSIAQEEAGLMSFGRYYPVVPGNQESRSTSTQLHRTLVS